MSQLATRFSPEDPWRQHLAREGFALISAALPESVCLGIRNDLEAVLARDTNGSALRTAAGNLYGARNLLRVWPGAAVAWRHGPLPELLREVLGERYGLVRALYFDKPPQQPWALPWHQDLTIAVKDNRLPSRLFRTPTLKAGVPHVEAPEAILRAMLTLRLHLDDVTEENGPLLVLPATHAAKGATSADGCAVTVLARAGDVLLMRPLLSHSSARSLEGTSRHRRIVHLEFAAEPELPDGYAWHDFLGDSSGPRSGLA